MDSGLRPRSAPQKGRRQRQPAGATTRSTGWSHGKLGACPLVAASQMKLDALDRKSQERWREWRAESGERRPLGYRADVAWSGPSYRGWLCAWLVRR